MSEMIALTDEQLVLLEGHLDEKGQEKVRLAKLRLAFKGAVGEGLNDPQKTFLSKVLEEATTNGKLVCYHTQMSYCEICKRTKTYAKYARSGLYHRKGEFNRDKPIRFSGIELADRFVRMEGYPTLGACNECMNTLLPHLRKHLAGMPVQLPKPLILEQAPLFYKSAHKECTKCGWKGHERQMGQLRTLMGDGHYFGKCPSCGIESTLFSNPVKTVDGFEIVEVAQ